MTQTIFTTTYVSAMNVAFLVILSLCFETNAGYCDGFWSIGVPFDTPCSLQRFVYFKTDELPDGNILTVGSKRSLSAEVHFPPKASERADGDIVTVGAKRLRSTEKFLRMQRHHHCRRQNASDFITCSRDHIGYGYFYVCFYCTGLCFQANIVEEGVMLSALFHIFVGLKRT